MIVISFIYFDPDWPLCFKIFFPTQQRNAVRVDEKLKTKGLMIYYFCIFLKNFLKNVVFFLETRKITYNRSKFECFPVNFHFIYYTNLFKL